MGIVVIVRHSIQSAETKILASRMLVSGVLLGFLVNTISSVPAHFYHSGYHGYHGHHLCETRLAIEKRELCHVEYEKECETKTRKFTKITGYEDVDCKEIEVCKFEPYHHHPYHYYKREADAEA